MIITNAFNIGRLQKQNLELIMSELQMESSSIIGGASLNNLPAESGSALQCRVPAESQYLVDDCQPENEYIVSKEFGKASRYFVGYNLILQAAAKLKIYNDF